MVAFENLPITTPEQSPEAYFSYHLYPIRIKENPSKKTQRQIYDALRQNGIAANLHYIPVHRHPYYEELGFKKNDFPDGLDVEVFKFKTLIKSQNLSKTNYNKEHITSFLRRSKKFKKYNYKSFINYSNRRWTLDNLKDYFFFKKSC